MITEPVLSVYSQIGGDLDGIGRWISRSLVDASMATSLRELDRLLQKASMVHRGLVDADFADQVRAEIRAHSASADVATQIWALAK